MCAFFIQYILEDVFCKTKHFPPYSLITLWISTQCRPKLKKSGSFREKLNQSTI